MPGTILKVLSGLKILINLIPAMFDLPNAKLTIPSITIKQSSYQITIRTYNIPRIS